MKINMYISKQTVKKKKKEKFKNTRQITTYFVKQP